MKHKLTQNMGLKILALFLAALLWIIVVNQDDPVTSAVYRNVPVTIKNEEVITNKGKIYQVIDETRTVNVTVKAKRSELSKITSDMIVATADIGQMNVDTLLVPIKANIPRREGLYESAETNPKNLQIEIEDSTKNNFPISVSATGTPRDGYMVGEMTTNPEKIVIKGPESVVRSIEKVVAKIDVGGLSRSTVLEAELILYDSNFNVINQAQLNNNLGTDGISVNVQILNTKNVNLEFGVSGKPKDGFVYTGWSSEPEKIQVCGTKEVLGELKTLKIPPEEINIDGADGNKEVTVDIQPYLPEGVSLVEKTANNVVVKVLVEKEGARTIELLNESIQMKNLAPNLKVASIGGQDLVLTFTGPKEILDVLDIRNAVSVDLKNYTTAGKYEVPVIVELAPGVALSENPTVKIVLTEKNEGE